MAVKKVLEGLLRTGSQAFYPHITPEVAADGLDYAVAYDVESWDGYLIAVARSLGATLLYSLDEELARVREILVVNPYPRDKVQEYREFIEARIRG